MKEFPEPLDKEPFKPGGAGKKPRVAEVCLHEHRMRPDGYRVGDGAHGAENNIVIEVLPFFPGEKREEFFFRTSVIQHRGFSQLPG